MRAKKNVNLTEEEKERFKKLADKMSPCPKCKGQAGDKNCKICFGTGNTRIKL